MYLTIFTPTYNRRQNLKDLYESLKQQTNSNFEWLVVDDGSTDETYDYLTQLLDESKQFSMRIYHQENGGKHRAINKAVPLAKGDYFFIVDSDNQLMTDAVEKVYAWCEDLEQDPHFKEFLGVSGLRIQHNGIIMGGEGDGREIIDASTFEREKYNLGGDKAEVVRTSILKQFPFPEFPGENFLSEGVVWTQMAAAGYKIRWHCEPIYISDYLPGGLTDSLQKNQLKNFEGYTLQTQLELRFQPKFKYRMAAIAKWAEIAEKKGLTPREAVSKLSMPVWSYFLSIFVFQNWVTVIKPLIKYIKSSKNDL